MPRMQPIRLVLAAILVLFSAPMTGLADALAFHRGEPRPVVPAVGAADASFGHADSCQLASHQGHATPEAALAHDMHQAGDEVRPGASRAPAPATPRTTLPPVRAPPLA